MSGGIFLIQGNGELVEMKEQPYDSEDVLQQLLAKYPNLLAGDQMDAATPRRWLLVAREMGVPGEAAGGDRWSLDHLFLDQDAVPTLVEVKRSSDTRIRREVVGQMLDYAANAVVYWPVETVRARFEETCRQNGQVAAAQLDAFLGSKEGAEAFWQRVKTNLQAGRVRMVFVADEIPPELRRVVEFLNNQMDPAEVLAVEVRQFVGQGLKSLVPRVIGQTAEAEGKKASAGSQGKPWDEDRFFRDLRERRGEEEAQAGRALLDLAKKNGLRIWWGRGNIDGSFYPMLDIDGQDQYTFAVWTYGKVEIPFQQMQSRRSFADEKSRLEWRDRLNQIAGLAIPADAITRRPTIPLAVLTNRGALEQFVAVLDWYLQKIRSA